MADTIYIITQGSKEHGLRPDDDGNPPDLTQYVYDDDKWTLCELKTEELTAVEEHLTNDDNKFVALLIPYEAVTFDADDKITAVSLP
tara:strand:- start:445 stop:705 length:261 start_codon:yes stop_codon:yes gene_type:complete